MSALEQHFRFGAVWLFAIASVYLTIQGAYLPAVVTMIACTSYIGMYFRGEDDIQEYRYADWLFTTPVILFVIMSKAGMSLHQIAYVIAADMLMIATGYLGKKEEDVAKSYLWFVLGMAFFVPVVIALMMSTAGSPAAAPTLAIWMLYPVVWIAKVSGNLGSEKENMITACMDVIAKVGFGLLSITA